ncbi:hypothetical protein [Nitrosomonas oligotropha]|nr:hypothetical protein [Nitrosomonas oligotropha]
MLESVIGDYPNNYPIAEESSDLDILERVSDISERVQKYYDKQEYQAELIDPDSGFRTYTILNETSIKKGAIYKLNRI